MSYGDDMGWGGGGGGIPWWEDPGTSPVSGGGGTPWWEDTGGGVQPGTRDWENFGRSRDDIPVGGTPSFGGGGDTTGGFGPALMSLAKMLGYTNKDGSLNLSGLLPMLASLGGGVYGLSQQKKAAGQMHNALDASNKLVTDALGKSSSIYAPFREAGNAALAKIQNLQPSSMHTAGFMKPLGNRYTLADLTNMGG